MTRRDAPGDRIVAIASPAGASSRAVLRVSGPEAWCALEPILAAPGRVAVAARGYRGRRIRLRAAAIEVDGWALFYRAPRSYTGEDLVELYLPGALPIIAACARDIVASGRARWAGPGEFTLRAFLGGRLDLAEAEAVEQLIRATDEQDARAARRALEGELSARVRSIADRALDAIALIEAALDFPDEDLPEISRERVASTLAGLEAEIATLRASSRMRLGPAGVFAVVLAGFPNAGKSSLLNRIVGSAAALVSPFAGTTRDPVRGTTREGDLEIEWIDLAGFDRLPGDDDSAPAPLGLEGRMDGEGLRALRRLTHLELEAADLVLWIVDPFDRPNEALALASTWTDKVEVVLNKCDLLDTRLPVGRIEEAHANRVFVSALTGEGVPELRRRVAERARGLSPRGAPPGESRPRGAAGAAESRYVMSAREESALLLAREAIERAAAVLAGGGGFELAAIDLREAASALESMTGELTTEDVLDRVFARFCIGK